MSSKILSTQNLKNSRHQSERTQALPQSGPEFRGLPNRALITVVLALVGCGLMAVYSSSAPDALQSFQDSTVHLRKQAIAAILGLIAMFALSRYDYRNLRKIAWPFAIFSLAMIAVTMIPGVAVTTMGSTRWIAIGPFQFQPSETAKISSLILMAAGLSKYFWWHKQVIGRIIVVLAMAVIVVKQPDLGTALMILSGMGSLLYVSGTYTWLIFSAIFAGGIYVWKHIEKTPYQMARIKSWLNPYSSPQGQGWNIIQSQYAIGSGGIFGLGFGRSLQKLHYLPVQHADFIFAVIAEEFGFLGCLALLSLFAIFAYHGFRTALQSRTLFGRFLAIGITSSITVQALVNIMVTTGVLPVTGVTLPFISYGGTSLVITLSMVGILLSISRDRGQFEEDEDLEPEPLSTTAPSARI